MTAAIHRSLAVLLALLGALLVAASPISAGSGGLAVLVVAGLVIASRRA